MVRIFRMALQFLKPGWIRIRSRQFKNPMPAEADQTIAHIRFQSIDALLKPDYDSVKIRLGKDRKIKIHREL